MSSNKEDDFCLKQGNSIRAITAYNAHSPSMQVNKRYRGRNGKLPHNTTGYTVSLITEVTCRWCNWERSERSEITNQRFIDCARCHLLPHEVKQTNQGLCTQSDDLEFRSTQIPLREWRNKNDLLYTSSCLSKLPK